MAVVAPQRVGRVAAPRASRSTDHWVPPSRSGQAPQVTHHDVIHAHRGQMSIGERGRVGSPPWPEEGTARKLGAPHVLDNGFGGREVQADRPMPPARSGAGLRCTFAAVPCPC